MSRLWLSLALAMTLILCGVGFVRFTQEALYRQEHGVLGAEHPWDFWAEGCLVLALVAVALFLLARAERVRPMRWRKARRQTRQGAKHRRRSGYNEHK